MGPLSGEPRRRWIWNGNVQLRELRTAKDVGSDSTLRVCHSRYAHGWPVAGEMREPPHCDCGTDWAVRAHVGVVQKLSNT